MIKKQINETDFITLYQSEHEIPMKLLSEMQVYLIRDAGIGSTLADVDNHFNRLDMFLNSGKLAEAIQERKNLHANFHLAFARINIKSFAFACLVHSINNEVITDYSEYNLKVIIDRLSEMGITYGMVSDTVDEIKKKLISA